MICDLSDGSATPNDLAHRPAIASPAHTPGSGHTALPLSRAPSTDSGGNGMGNLTILDLELLHHYCVSTCLTLSSDSIMRNYLQVSVPQLGFSHPYVLYCILALAASHLAHFRPESRQYYLAEAAARHTSATSMAAPLLTDIPATQSIPMYCFSILTLFISFASLREDEDSFFDADNVIPSWLTLFRGMRTVMEANDLYSSSISFLFRRRPDVNQHWESNELNHDPLTELQDHINESPSETDETRGYLLKACIDIERSYYFFYGEEYGNETKMRGVFTWMYKVSNEYVNMVRHRNHNALCILAFFCVLLHQMEYNWWLKGWATHLIDRIYTVLDDRHRFYIRWPIQEIGWIPKRE